MAITTLDGVIAGGQIPAPILKVGATTAAVGSQRAYTPWYANGNPGASVTNTAGVNGQAVTPALNTPVNVIAGKIPRNNPASGNAHIGRFQAAASTAGTLWLVDRLWQNSGLSTTLTTAQAITAAALLPRDGTGTTNGVGVFAGIEWAVAGGAGAPTVTLTYTSQDGTAGRTATFTGVASPPVGTVEIFSPTAANGGVRAPSQYQASATRTSGTMNLVLFRFIAPLNLSIANIPDAIDFVTGGGVKIHNDSVLQLLWFPTVTTATTIVGQYIETHG